MKNRHRFTLVELFIVVTILALLTAMLLPALSSFRDKQKQYNRKDTTTNSSYETKGEPIRLNLKYKYEYNGHIYLRLVNFGVSEFVHDPDCQKCKNDKALGRVLPEKQE